MRRQFLLCSNPIFHSVLVECVEQTAYHVLAGVCVSHFAARSRMESAVLPCCSQHSHHHLPAPAAIACSAAAAASAASGKAAPSSAPIWGKFVLNWGEILLQKDTTLLKISADGGGTSLPLAEAVGQAEHPWACFLWGFCCLKQWHHPA